MKKQINITETEIQKYIKDAINEMIFIGKNQKGVNKYQLRHDIAIKSYCFSCDFKEGIARVGFKNNNEAHNKEILRVLTTMDFPNCGFKVLKVEDVSGKEDMLPFNPEVIYQIYFEENKQN